MVIVRDDSAACLHGDHVFLHSASGELLHLNQPVLPMTPNRSQSGVTSVD